MEKVDQGVAPPGVVGGPLFAAVVVEVLIDALVGAIPHRCWPRVIILGEGMVRPVVPLPWRSVCHRQAARVAVLQLGGLQRDDDARGGLYLDLGCPGARDGVVELTPTPRVARAQGTWWTQWPPARVANLPPSAQGGTRGHTVGKASCKLRDGVVYLGADAVQKGDFPELPGDLRAHRG